MFLVGSLLVALGIGPIAIGPGSIAESALSHLSLLHLHARVSSVDEAILWQRQFRRIIGYRNLAKLALAIERVDQQHDESRIVHGRETGDGEAVLRLERGEVERTDRRARQRAGPDGCGWPLLELAALREDAVGHTAEQRAGGELVRDARGRLGSAVQVL